MWLILHSKYAGTHSLPLPSFSNPLPSTPSHSHPSLTHFIPLIFFLFHPISLSVFLSYFSSLTPFLPHLLPSLSTPSLPPSLFSLSSSLLALFTFQPSPSFLFFFLFLLVSHTIFPFLLIFLHSVTPSHFSLHLSFFP